MNVDVLLIFGTCVVVGLIGLEAGFKMAENKIPDSLNELATALANLHQSHGETKTKMESHSVKINELITKIVKTYSLEK